MEKEKGRVVSIYVSGSELDALNFLTQTFGKSQGDVIRKAMRQLADMVTGDKYTDEKLCESIQ